MHEIMIDEDNVQSCLMFSNFSIDSLTQIANSGVENSVEQFEICEDLDPQFTNFPSERRERFSPPS